MVFKIPDEQAGNRYKSAPTKPVAAAPVKPKKKRFKKATVVLPVLIIVALIGLLSYRNIVSSDTHKAHYFPSYVSKDQMTIPVYYPVGVPSGYGVSDFKIIKKNIMTFTVTNLRGEKFYVSEQPLVTSFDFEGFKKKFAKPDEYNTPIGSNLVGVAGADLIASIQTSDSVWIIINSKALTSIKDMETITRSFRTVQL
jgi:hypothetical protein